MKLETTVKAHELRLLPIFPPSLKLLLTNCCLPDNWFYAQKCFVFSSESFFCKSHPCASAVVSKGMMHSKKMIESFKIKVILLSNYQKYCRHVFLCFSKTGDFLLILSFRDSLEMLLKSHFPSKPNSFIINQCHPYESLGSIQCTLHPVL